MNGNRKKEQTQKSPFVDLGAIAPSSNFDMSTAKRGWGFSTINIKSTFKHLQKNKFHALLNIFGLALGLLFFFQLVRYIAYEKGYDAFFEGADRIYRINYDVDQNGEQVLHSAKTPDRLFRVLKDEIPGVEYAALSYLENVLIRYGDKYYNDQPNLWVDGDFVEMFGLEIISGTSKLKDKLTCIVSESMAKNIFGNENPIGKTLYVNEGMPHEVTGIFKDIPSNSHIHFNFFMPTQTFVHYGWMSPEGGWYGDFCWTYVKMKEGFDQSKLDIGLNSISEKYLTHLTNQQRKGSFVSQPVTQLHYSSSRSGELNTSTREKTITALILIAIFILAVIWMNYINLSTSLSRKRINIFATYRKLGANKFTMIKLSLIESLMINIAAIVVTCFLFYFTDELFNKLIGKDLSTGIINHSVILTLTAALIVAGIILTSFISAIPAIRVNPAFLRQRSLSKTSGTQWLVALQFFISCFLIICSIMITKQIRFMQKAELGINIDNVIILKGATSTNSDPHRMERFNAFRADVLKNAQFISGTATMNIPGEPLRFRNNNITIPGKNSELKQTITIGNIDEGFIETYNLKLLAGNNFDLSRQLDSAKIIISESAAKIFGFNTPAEAIDQQIVFDNITRTIKGVVNDFHQEGLKKPLEPMLFTHEHPFEFGLYSMRFKGNIKDAIQHIGQVWPKHYPNDPCDYFLCNDFFNKQYNEEKRLNKILTMFTLFAIIVASLGLFGMISFFTQQRTKEIGIRKVNGATVGDIMLMVFSYFSKFEIAAFVLACPLAWFAIDRWLQGFAYKTTISWWVFFLTGLTALLISTISVVSQVYMAATKNPVEALRYE
jgi:putative ABC transport system permease protein